MTDRQNLLRTVFHDRHGELRVHWRLAVAVLLTGTLLPGALYAAAAAGWTDTMAMGTASLAGALLANAVLTRLLNRKPVTAIGLGVSPSPFPDLIAGTMMGIAAIGGIALLLGVSGQASFTPNLDTVPDAFLLTVYGLLAATVVAAAEELVFRGYIFQTLSQAVTLLPASLLISGLFAAAHFRNPSVTTLGFLNIGLAGLLFCFAFAKTGRLWLPLGLHAGWNFAQLTLAGFPASGLADPSRMLVIATVDGPQWWTGGGFGPEGGLAGTAALLVLGWVVLKSRRFRRPAGVVTLDSVEDLLEESKN